MNAQPLTDRGERWDGDRRRDGDRVLHAGLAAAAAL